MLIDARTIPTGTEVESDVCIVGAGPAGLTLAGELVGSRLNVCLLEAGGPGMEEGEHGFVDGDVVGAGHAPLAEGRASGLGGSTSIWYGISRPFDAADFAPRPWVSDAGWPFGLDELEPYYRRAQVACRLGPYAYRADDWATGDRASLPLPSARLSSIAFQLNAVRFGSLHEESLRRATNVSVLLRANAVEVEVSEDAGRVTAVRVATGPHRQIRVRARLVVLAAGGIENARLLLDSRSRLPAGVGNAHDLVGRYFQEHLYVSPGWLRLSVAGSARLYRPHRVGSLPLGARVQAAIALDDGLLGREGLLRGCFFFLPPFREHADFFSPGMRSLQYLTQTLRARQLPDRPLVHLRQLLANAAPVAHMVRSSALDRWRQRLVATQYCGEQEPNLASRVVLTASQDRFGRRRPLVEWRMTELDRRSIRRAHSLLAEAVSDGALGTYRPPEGLDEESPPGLRACCHHMGTTRMHVDPARGVVDPDGQVHDVFNLYVAGSSVFPTGGFANPTLTIVALALRLAERIKQVATSG